MPGLRKRPSVKIALAVGIGLLGFAALIALVLIVRNELRIYRRMHAGIPRH